MGVAQLEDYLQLGGAYFNKSLVLAARDAWETATRNVTTDTPVQTRVRIHNALGSLFLDIARLDAAHHHFTQARELCESLSATMGESLPDYPRVLNNLALTLLRSGQVDEALPLALSAARLSHGLGSDAALTTSINLVAGVCLMNRADWLAARVNMADALATVRVMSDKRWEAACLNNLGIIALELGDLAQAQQLLEEALHSLVGLHDAGLSAYVRTELGRLHFRMGDAPGALHHGSAALRILWDNMGFHDRAEVARLCRLFAHIFALKGDRAAALSYLQRATTYFAQSQMWREWSEATQELDGLIHGRNLQRERVVIEYQDQELLRYLTTLLGLMDTLEGLYPESASTVELVAKYALILGEASGFDAAKLARLASAARLRDVGLTSESEAVNRENPRGGGHPVMGARVLAMFGVPESVLAAVNHHHEFYDGSGYPDGLSGTGIPLEARILTLAEYYVNAVNREVAQGPGYHHRAISQLQANSQLFDPELLTALIKLHDVQPN